MKKSTKAALLSGLVFPGIGHLILQQYWRGSALILSSLIAMSVIIEDAYRQAMTIVDRIYSGDIPVDTAAMAEMIANSSTDANDLKVTTATVVFFACWLIGIIDSYRVGLAADKEYFRKTQ